MYSFGDMRHQYFVTYWLSIIITQLITQLFNLTCILLILNCLLSQSEILSIEKRNKLHYLYQYLSVPFNPKKVKYYKQCKTDENGHSDVFKERVFMIIKTNNRKTTSEGAQTRLCT